MKQSCKNTVNVRIWTYIRELNAFDRAIGCDMKDRGRSSSPDSVKIFTSPFRQYLFLGTNSLLSDLHTEGGYFPGDKGARGLNLTTFNYCQGQENVDIYIHTP
jgi:hypothetical protein